MYQFIVRISKLLNRRERKQFVGVVVLMLIRSVLEASIILAIFPFIGMLRNPDQLHSIWFLQWIYETLGFNTDRQFLVFAGILLLLLILMTNCAGAISLWSQQKFGWMRVHSLSCQLLGSYLARPYPFFLSRSGSELAKNIHQEVQQSVTGLLIPIMDLLSRGLTALLILFTLLWMDWRITLGLVALFGSTYVIIFRLSRSSLHSVGRDTVASYEARFRIINEVLDNIKVTKLNQLEDFFTHAFRRPSYKYARAATKSAVIGGCPRFVLEAIAFGGMLGVVLVLLQSNAAFGDIVPLLSVYAIAGYRLMPAMGGIFQSAARIKATGPSVAILLRDLPFHVAPQTMVAMSKFTQSIVLENVSVIYGSTSTPAIEHVSLTIPRKSSVALVGPTGAGKTTVADVLLGLLSPTRGRMLVDGTTIDSSNVRQWQRNLGYVPQNLFLVDDTIAANIAMGISPEEIDHERLHQSAKAADILHLIESELENGWSTVVGERGIRLSGGQIQRLGIARALYRRPDVLVLDEATSALDNITEQRILQRIGTESHDQTIIMIAHRLTTIRNCDFICVLDGGRVVDVGTWEELISRCDLFQKLALAQEDA